MIKISPIPDRAGQLLRNSLRDKLTPRGVPSQPRYRLDIGLNETRTNLVILKDATSTYSKLRMVATFALVDLQTGKPVQRGQSESTTTFNRVDSDFADLAAEKDARRRAADEISEDIRLRLGLYFNRLRGT
ncbi:LPS assembly lipoprotein LptE [Nisaea acidiphila]|uniref:LPS assembly lipoprotein LptE n=1 Tax=Nisaea acidiphila TaxID=1862145 RepID=A0A9J7AJV3_9PROT|nr:LPS assembly lipoprotein LptE [Nisaea acidiphila]UUX47947.1 LPS assembly lipoprotein LptE [Nisaea acidiphila]